MKILLVSNVPEGVDGLVNSFDEEGTTIVARELSADARDMANGAYDAFSRGNFEVMVIHSDNPVASSLAFNKISGAAAAVCTSAEDVPEAMSNGANILILKGSESSYEAILGAAARSAPSSGRQQAPLRVKPSRPQPAPRQQAPERQQQTEIRLPKLQIPNLLDRPAQAKREREEPEDMRIPTGPRRPGVMGWLKDELGIVDEMESGQARQNKK
ncbi:MAG: hypothetical protein KGH64_02985 [Candidatus Micrarchaeota archaeon]|nr:hypothetical protein [Candidatus Micrarchaeota archaeon]MDE1834278.1 hypothetical protein [Candidatus Micrarchaeota archaeon]MDE1859418.1 hypothetical protein [Candidatus Micrarchaeota archaeon]